MQRKKVFHVSLYLDLHAVTCPGVWLCPKGKVAVRVALFGVCESTKKLTPSFPLFFHERFHFQKKYKKASNLHQVERVLHRAPVLLELLQYPQGTTECVKLAEFKATVGDIIYPPGGDMDLLFSTTETFPGIIGPKGEVTTRLTLTEGGIKDNSAMPTTVFSKGTKGKQIEESLIRQKPVCHTKHYLYCGCFDKDGQQRILAKVMKRKKDLLTKKRTSQEVGRPSPAHIMSHKNHGDSPPGFDVLSDDFEGGEVKFGRCSCCQEETAFGGTSDQPTHVISEDSSVRGKNTNDGFTVLSQPQPRWNPPIDDKYDSNIPEEEENDPLEIVPPLLPNKKDAPCCLCCPNAPGYVKKRSSSEMNKDREMPSNLQEKKYQYPSEGKRNHSNPTEDRMYRSLPPAVEEELAQSYPIQRKKDVEPLPCPLCDNNNKLKQLIRKSNGDKQKESNGAPLFYSNLCKAYQRLMNEYYIAPQGFNSST